MSKKYFCENIIGLDVCGESDPINFSSGRYTRCKKCRNQDTRKRLQEKKELLADETIDKKVEELKDGRKIQLLIEDIIIGKPLMQGGMTISDWIHLLDTNIVQCRKTEGEHFLSNNERIKNLETENELIKKENRKLKNEISQIKTFLEEKFEKIFETF